MRANACLRFLAFAFTSAAAYAQDAPPPQKPADPLPDLDELLGLPSQKKDPLPAPEGPPSPTDEPLPEFDPNKAELGRKLTAEEMAEKFVEAVRQMGESADRMERLGDLGIETQRLHEEILRKLDLLVKQSQSGGSSSSSSSSSSSRSDDAQRAQQQQRQQGQQDQAGPGENRGQALTPPAMVDAERQARLDTARAAWGSLPDRIRDSLLEGSNDYFSSLYEGLTEAYYKRIAEEARE